MGIYIRGVELPFSCKSCPFEICGDCNAGKFKYIMDVDDNDEQYRNRRHPTCPLIEVPEPHGRLIDESVAYDKIAEQETGYYMDMDGVDRGLQDAPTVIEGSER